MLRLAFAFGLLRFDKPEKSSFDNNGKWKPLIGAQYFQVIFDRPIGRSHFYPADQVVVPRRARKRWAVQKYAFIPGLFGQPEDVQIERSVGK